MLLVNSAFDYSIVICVYNADQRVLQRCLESVERLDTSGLSREIIIADNNSITPAGDIQFVKNFIERTAAKLIVVKEQGVKYARMRAIESSTGQYIVYVDSDNEPSPNYLKELKALNARYPEVAAWGPGTVKVDFIDGIDLDVEQYARIAFQEKTIAGTQFAAEHSWQDCYPFGTGLCTYRSVLLKYIAYAEQGKFSLTGRRGANLSSGEDTEMVLLAIKEGYAAGSSASLKLTHIIPGTRANINYLKRLAYGTSVCYATCLLEIFPEKEKEVRNTKMRPQKFTRKTLKKLIAAKFSRDPLNTTKLAYFLGTNKGVYLALKEPVPSFINIIIKWLKLE